MPRFEVSTPQASYPVIVERDAISRVAEFIPSGAGRLFVVTTQDVWDLHGAKLNPGRPFETLFFPGGESRKRLTQVELLADQMGDRGADRSSVVIAFGGGIVGDLAGFLAAIYMRGIPVIQVPSTLLAQVDASVGGKTGANLVSGKNLIGAFHQPLAVLIDPAVLSTLPEREYRAGLYEVIKCGTIANGELFRMLDRERDAILAQEPEITQAIIAESVRIKAEVVSADEKESGLRRILNFGHTFGHALEAETAYTTFLHGEAVSWGMRGATYLAVGTGLLPEATGKEIVALLERYGPIPSTSGISVDAIKARLVKDKKTIQSKVHFVLPVRIGEVTVRSGIDEAPVQTAIERALNECR